MKTPDSRRHFQTATRHYHRHREESRGWDDWIDAEKEPGRRRRRRWWIAATLSLVAAAAGSLFAFDLL